MKRLRGTVGAVLVIMIVLSLVACSNTNENPVLTVETTTTKAQVTEQTTTKAVESVTTASQTTAEPKEENPFEEFFEITYLVRWTEPYEEGRWDELELEEKFNIDLKVWNIDCYSAEQAAMMVAAGDWADTGYVNGYSPVTAYKDGLTRSVTLQQIKDYLPEFYRFLDENPIGLKINKIPEKENEYYGISSVFAQNNYWYTVNCFRLDWLENIGYDITDLQEVKFTYDGLAAAAEDVVFLSNRVFDYNEFTDIMKQFTESDPDGDGEDNTFGSLFPNYEPTYGWHWTEIYTGMFGISYNNTWLYYDELSGNYVPSYATTGWRDYLVFINDMMQKGYIRFVENINNAVPRDLYSMLATGAVGHYPLDASNTMDPAKPANIPVRPPISLLDKDPDAKIVITPAILGPDGKGGNSKYVDMPFRDGAFGTWTFGHGVDSEAKLKRVMALLQYTHFTDAWYRYAYGIEGIHFKWTGEPYQSSVVTTDPAKIPKKYTSNAIQGIFGTDLFMHSFKNWSMKSEFFYALCNYQLENDWFEIYTLIPDKLCHVLYMGEELYDEYMKIRQNVNSDIMTVANAFMNAGYNGELGNIYAEWENYIEQLYSAGLDRYVEIFNREEFGVYDIDLASLYK